MSVHDKYSEYQSDGVGGHEIKGLQFQWSGQGHFLGSVIYWECRQRSSGLPRYTSGWRRSFCLLPEPLAAAPSQKDLSSQTLSQKAACIYDKSTWKNKRLTICPQPEQFWRAVPAPCGVAGGLHRNCTTVQLLPLPSPASLPITDVVSEFTPWLASSTQSSETPSLFPRKCDLWQRLSNLDLIFQQKAVEQGLAPGAACPCGLGPLLLSSAVLHSSLFQSVRQQEIWNFWAIQSIRVVVAMNKKRRGDVNFKSRRY